MLGLSGAGKTTILYYLKGCLETVKAIPTVNFNLEIFEYKDKFKANVYDLAGLDKNTINYKGFCKCTDGLIFVVDSNDRDRIENAAVKLKEILAEEELKGCPVLVIANKQDLNVALVPGEVADKMGMTQFKGITWLVQGASGITGQGLKEGFDWLLYSLAKK
jgi:small GTP-binding protein